MHLFRHARRKRRAGRTIIAKASSEWRPRSRRYIADRKIVNVGLINPSTRLADDGSLKTEVLNKKALKIISRVQDKLTGRTIRFFFRLAIMLHCLLGRDFSPDEWNTVQEQVDQLIRQAQSNENLCQCYIGW